MDPNIATVTFEKMLVIFYQIGLRRGNIFNRFLGFDNEPLLRERFCVHGAIEAITSREKTHIFAEAEEDNTDKCGKWLTTWLYDEGIISRNSEENRKHYLINGKKLEIYLRENELNNISDDIKNEIDGIADLIAQWYALSKNNKDMFKEDITALTSCCDSLLH